MRERFKQMQNQWQQQRQRIEAALVEIRSLNEADVIRAIERSIFDMDRSFAQLNGDQSLQELEARGAARLAFMEAQLERINQQIKDSVLEARQRARSLQAAVNDLANRLQAAGMQHERKLLLAERSVGAIERAAQILISYEQDLQKEQSNQEMHEALMDLGISAISRHLNADFRDPTQERIEQLLVQLELLDTGSVATNLHAAINALDGELDPHQRRVRLDSLALQISEALQQGKEAAERLATLNDLEAQLGVFDTVPARLLDAIADQRRSKKGVSTLKELRQEVESWCEEEARRVDGERMRSVVLGSLRDLGYELREGMATGWVEGDSIVIQKEGNSGYAVELQDLNGRLRSQVIRYGDPSLPANDQQRQRDTEVEKQWCSAHAQTLDNLRQQGIEAQIMAKREPGDVPLVVVRTGDASHSSRRSDLAGNLNQSQRGRRKH
ncbi:hypothetical protein MY494_12645 [Synechococcus sp. A10-1-5-1]|uniref:hypothetical protein n=1 Tax=Synechococcus sp. A10-1-5-1 TaxID=2936507 RepID=UPI0020009D27|nr:hypothetical protein [Synechococcus sp. A10-1-5-1]UPM50134.1 hypothetical protein MY494_12645 [Synechococcus sp. A10-1-5-1]